jgi:hypothetical protein
MPNPRGKVSPDNRLAAAGIGRGGPARLSAATAARLTSPAGRNILVDEGRMGI